MSRRDTAATAEQAESGPLAPPRGEISPLLWTAGVPRAMRAALPKVERWQLKSEGAAVWVTTLFAGLAAALATLRFWVGAPHWAIAGAAAFWMLVIFLLDRSLLISIHASSRGKWVILLRVAIATLSSALIADQLALSVFSDRLARVRGEQALMRQSQDYAQLRSANGLDRLEGSLNASTAEQARLDRLRKTRPGEVQALDAQLAPLQTQYTTLSQASERETAAGALQISALSARRQQSWQAFNRAQQQGDFAALANARASANARSSEITALESQRTARNQALLAAFAPIAELELQIAAALKAHRARVDQDRVVVSSAAALQRTSQQAAQSALESNQSQLSRATQRAFSSNWIAEAESLAVLEQQSPVTRILRWQLTAMLLLIELLPMLLVCTGAAGSFSAAAQCEIQLAKLVHTLREKESECAVQIDLQSAADAVIGRAKASAVDDYAIWRASAAQDLHWQLAQKRVQQAERVMRVEMDLARTLADRWVLDQAHFQQIMQAQPALTERLAELLLHATQQSAQTQRAALNSLRQTLLDSLKAPANSAVGGAS